MEIKTIAAQANWSSIEKRPTWGTVTSMELSRILGVSLQSINNWRVRGYIPEPEPRQNGQGNKNRWTISRIKNWLYGVPEELIHWNFIHTYMDNGFESIEQAKRIAQKYWRAFEIERV